MKKLLPLVCAFAATLAAQTPAATTKAPAAGAAKKAATGTATKAGTATKTGVAKKAPVARKLPLTNPALFKEKAPETFKVKFTTTKGDFVIQVNRAWAPLGADRFYNLVKNGYYDNAGFFRIVPNFVVQFGISARPEVSAAWSKAKITDDPVTQSNKTGYVTFATAGPGTRTTQMFINLKDNTPLDAMGFAPIGMVVEGMDVVNKLNQEYGERPEQPKIEAEGSAYLTKNFPNLDFIKSTAIVP